MPVVDQVTFQSTLPGVFFGGDAAFGPKNIIWAVAHGHDAAISIDKHCHGEDLRDRPPPDVTLASQKMGIHEWSYDNAVSIDLRFKVPHRDKREALTDIKAEVELGFDLQQAFKEAQRCLNCDVQTVFAPKLCIECDACVDICPVDCITFTENGDEPDLRTPPERAGAEPDAGTLRRRRPENRPDHGQGRGCLPALRPLRRALPHRGLGHAALLAEHARRSSRRGPSHASARDASTTSSSNSPTSTAPARPAPTSSSPNRSCAWACPATPRNIFPSNIQGLPTWYEVRVSEANHLGARGGVDLMVAMNPQTWDEDVKSIDPGGYLFYDSTRPLHGPKIRSDITLIGVPLTAICNAEYTDSRQRQLFKNIIYVGALSALLDIEPSVIETLLAEQFKSKEKLIAANVHALHLGRDYALANLACPIGLRVRKSDKVGDRIFLEGNAAAGLGAVYGGATVCAWYPITPSTSLAEAFTRYCERFRVDPATNKKKFAIIQAEDELASIGMVIGAGWNGARAFTATSGPGISLMQEFLGLSYFAEIPAVIFDVQRAGPSTGMPTRTQQCDVTACAYASHGDTKHVLLFPEDPHECFSLRRPRLRPGGPAADRRSSSCSTSISA